MITVKCPACRDWDVSSSTGTGLLQALRAHQANCPDYRGINFLKEKTR